MKRIVLYFLAACFTACGFSAQAKHMTKVVAFVNLTDMKAAWLEMQDTRTNNTHSITTRQLVRQGDRFTDEVFIGGRVQVEIVQIDFTNGTIKAKEDGAETIYQFKLDRTAGTTLAQPGIHFVDASLDTALDFYALIVGRTVLVHPDVHQMTAPVSIQARDKAEFVSALEGFMREEKIAAIPDGNKFELIVPERLEKATRSNLDDSSSQKPDTETPGISLQYSRVDLGQVLTHESLPLTSFNLQTQAPLTKAEVLHAFDTLFAWHGVKVVNIDEKTFKIVQIGKP